MVTARLLNKVNWCDCSDGGKNQSFLREINLISYLKTQIPHGSS